MRIGRYTARPLVEGFPGTSTSHGAFGWSSLWLLDDGQRRILIDAGQPAYIPLIHAGLGQLGMTSDDVTDVVVTHLHWDHVANFTMFANAVTWVGERELSWAAAQPSGTEFISELHVAELQRRAAVQRMAPGDEIAPGLHVIDSAGHTPHHLAFNVEDPHHGLIFAGDAVKNVRELATHRAESTMDADSSRRTIERLTSLMRDTSAMLIPGHDVALSIRDGAVTRVRPQHAQIAFVSGADVEPQDRSIG
jgi:N-acyl homoserine lactone hydrolase